MFEASRAHIDALTQARAASPEIADKATTIITSAGLGGEFRDQIRDSGLVHLAKVGATRQAVKAEDAGVDGIIASGHEMCGHTHLHPVHPWCWYPTSRSTCRVDGQGSIACWSRRSFRSTNRSASERVGTHGHHVTSRRSRPRKK